LTKIYLHVKIIIHFTNINPQVRLNLLNLNSSLPTESKVSNPEQSLSNYLEILKSSKTKISQSQQLTLIQLYEYTQHKKLLKNPKSIYLVTLPVHLFSLPNNHPFLCRGALNPLHFPSIIQDLYQGHPLFYFFC